MRDYNLIINFFDEYINHYRELLSFENVKLNYIITNNVTELSNCLGKEQALIMKGNALESKRISMLEKQGLRDMKFKDIIESSPEQYSNKLSSVFGELSKYVSEVKRINDEALSIVKTRLTTIEKKLSKGKSETYDGKGDKKRSVPIFSSLAKNI